MFKNLRAYYGYKWNATWVTCKIQLHKRERECRGVRAERSALFQACFYSSQTSVNQHTGEQWVHNLLQQISKYFTWHSSLFLSSTPERHFSFLQIYAVPPYGCGCEKDLASAEGWRVISNKPTEKAGLHRAPYSQNSWGPQGSSLIPSRTQRIAACLLEQGFLGFIVRQMCCHGNPSQALNLPLCRGMLSLLTAVFPCCLSLLHLCTELEELHVPLCLLWQQEDVVRLGMALEARKWCFPALRHWTMCSRCWSRVWCGIVIQLGRQVLLSREKWALSVHCCLRWVPMSYSVTWGELDLLLPVFDLVQQRRLQCCWHVAF